MEQSGGFNVKCPDLIFCFSRGGTINHFQPDFLDGRVLRSARFAGLALGEIEYASGYRRERHLHKRACLHLVLAGGYTEYRHGNAKSCGALMLLFQPAGFEHSYVGYERSSRVFTIEFDDTWIERLAAHSIVPRSPAYLSGGLELSLINRLHREFAHPDACAPLAIEALATELVAEVWRRQKRELPEAQPRWLRQATELLHDRFAEALSLQSIADAVGVHPVHLARAFKKHHHCTVGDYLRRVRVDFAMRQMIASDTPLLEIALSAGFSDQSRFCHTFKRIVGLTPAVFRSEMRKR